MTPPHASAVGLGDKSDNEVLKRARAEDRLIVTADLDYPRLLALMKADRPGLILFRGGTFSDTEMLDLLDRVLAESDSLDLEHSIVVVDRHRIHRRQVSNWKAALTRRAAKRRLPSVLTLIRPFRFLEGLARVRQQRGVQGVDRLRRSERGRLRVGTELCDELGREEQRLVRA